MKPLKFNCAFRGVIKRNCRLLVAVPFLFFLIGGCQSKKEVNSAFLCLSFDDQNLESWVAILPLLDQYQAKVTFFLTGVTKLGGYEQNQLQQIIKAGHDFGGHGELHVSANRYIENNGYLSYWREEIHANKQGLVNLGLAPEVFAYPFGEKNPLMDPIIKTYFSHTRNVAQASEIQAPQPAMLTREIGKEIFSLGIDNRENLDSSTIGALLDSAVIGKKALFLHAHDIGDEMGYMINYGRLEDLLKMAELKGIPLITYEEALQNQ
ncbi:MAG: polysaccharide deacetylase family protein [Cyclobacteriaceae bacterium]